MRRRELNLLSAFVLGVGAIPVPGLHLLAGSRGQTPETRSAPFRDVEPGRGAPRIAACLPQKPVRVRLIRARLTAKMP